MRGHADKQLMFRLFAPIDHHFSKVFGLRLRPLRYGITPCNFRIATSHRISTHRWLIAFTKECSFDSLSATPRTRSKAFDHDILKHGAYPRWSIDVGQTCASNANNPSPPRRNSSRSPRIESPFAHHVQGQMNPGTIKRGRRSGSWRDRLLANSS